MTGDTEEQIIDAPGIGLPAAFSPFDNSIVYAGHRIEVIREKPSVTASGIMKYDYSAKEFLPDFAPANTPANRNIVFALSFSPDAQRIAVLTTKGIHLWDGSMVPYIAAASDGHVINVPESEGVASTVVFSRDGRYIAAPTRNLTVKVWRAR